MALSRGKRREDGRVRVKALRAGYALLLTPTELQDTLAADKTLSVVVNIGSNQKYLRVKLPEPLCTLEGLGED